MIAASTACMDSALVAIKSQQGEVTTLLTLGFTRTAPRYKQVFHPDVTEQAKATIIEVTEGSEANDVDIKLGAALQTFSASGRVIDSEKGLPVPNIPFSLQRLAGQRAEFVNAPVMSNCAGRIRCRRTYARQVSSLISSRT